MDEVNEKHSGSNDVSAISMIITTIKDNIVTMGSLEHCPVPYEVVISNKRGLGYARNW